MMCTAGMPYQNQRLIREYATQRPVKLVPGERIMGYAGKYERGICVVQPHKGLSITHHSIITTQSVAWMISCGSSTNSCFGRTHLSSNAANPARDDVPHGGGAHVGPAGR